MYVVLINKINKPEELKQNVRKGQRTPKWMKRQWQIAELKNGFCLYVQINVEIEEIPERWRYYDGMEWMESILRREFMYLPKVVLEYTHESVKLLLEMNS